MKAGWGVRLAAYVAVAFSLVSVGMGADAWQTHKARKRAAVARKQAQRAARARRARAATPESGAPAFVAVGPRQVSNRTGYPLMLWGTGLRPGMRVRVGDRTLETAFLDAEHLTARMPADLSLPRKTPAIELPVHLVDEDGKRVAGEGKLMVINDLSYAVPTALATSPGGGQVIVATPATDALWVRALGGEAAAGGADVVRRVPVGDGPVALSAYRDAAGAGMLAVLHADAGEVWLMALPALDGALRRIPVGRGATDLHVRPPTRGASGRLYVSLPSLGVVDAHDLATGERLWRTATGPRPSVLGGVGGVGGEVFVGDHALGGISVLTGKGERRGTPIVPGPGAAIVGGHTAPFAQYVMAGTPVRDLVASARHGVVFASSVGPSIGPNPARMEVSMAGGISVVDLAAGSGPSAQRYLRHVALPHGVAQGLWLDDARDLLYAADVATGRVYALDVRALLSDERAGEAVLAELQLTPPADATLLRPRVEFERAAFPGPVSLHTGPWALSASPDGRTLYVLERFTGRVTPVDVGRARSGSLRALPSLPVVDVRALRQRRLGEIAYFTDLGGTRMSCDSCHVDGHGGGMLFTKREPMHIYRVPSLRSIRTTAPYFTPAFLPNLQAVSRFVLDRNRGGQPAANRREVGGLSLYQASLVVDPNPWAGARGELPRELPLPGGGTGDAVAGLAVFEGAGRCTACHPPPGFTTDQMRATRRRTHDIGTPVTLPLRPGMQDGAAYPLPPPSLAGVRDNYPLLHSGAAGIEVRDGRLAVSHADALSAVLQLGTDSGKHGQMAALSPEQKRDLLAYLRTL